MVRTSSAKLAQSNPARNAAEQETKVREPATDPAPPPNNKLNTDPELIAKLFQQKTLTGKDALSGQSPIRYQELTFELEGETCSPDFFVNEDGEFFDVQIGMRALDSAKEINAVRSATSGVEVPYLMAKAMLYKLNGSILTIDQREFLWEGMGPGGRQLCMLALQKIGAASDGALGKFLETYTVS